MNYNEYKLENGARLISIPLPSTESITTMVMYPVGSRYEPEPLSGVSHYIEHIMFKGTKKRPNPLILTREIDRLGAEYNAFTGKEYTGYYIKADKQHFSTSLDILSDMLLNSLFDAEEMEREKGVIIEEIKMYADNPLMNIENIFEEVMFTGSLGRDIAGTAKHVSSYKRDDVLAYRDSHYFPKNMTIVVAGAVTDTVQEQVAEYFAQAQSSMDMAPAPHKEGYGPLHDKQHIKVDKKPSDQSQLMIGFPAYAHTELENDVPLKVLNTILGGSMSSRLFMEIREKRGLAYMVRSGEDSFLDAGYSFVRAGLDTKNINEAIKVSLEEIEKIKQGSITAQELEDAKTRIHGLLSLSLEDSSSVVMWYAKQALFMPEIDNPRDFLARIDKVSIEDITRVANDVFDREKMRIGVIGNIDPEHINF